MRGHPQFFGWMQAAALPLSERFLAYSNASLLMGLCPRGHEGLLVTGHTQACCASLVCLEAYSRASANSPCATVQL